MRILPKVVLTGLERERENPTREIAALRPTPREDAAWSEQKPHHAWLVFGRYGAIPALTIFAGSATVGMRRHDHWWWLFGIGFAVFMGGFSWLSMWAFEEQPRRQLTFLRATRLDAALRAEEMADAGGVLPAPEP